MMWEQIRSNRTRTTILVAGMAALLIALGWAIAEAYVPGGGVYGVLAATVLWFIMTMAAYFQGDRILLAVSGAKKIEKSDYPELYNVVEEMKIASGLSHMPDIYIINDPALNAFATGRKPERCAVAITSGLLEKLNRDELQGVMAHEVAHIVNRDVLLMSMVGVMLGTIVMIADVYLRAMFRGAGPSRRYSSSSSGRGGGGGGNVVMIVVALALAILAPLLAQLIYFAISRRREFLADASAAVFTRYPDGLASALEQLSSSGLAVRKANKATAAMYIVNPFANFSLNELTSTHPRTEERIRILRSMGGKISYRNYQQAWTGAGRRNRRFPQSALKNDVAVAARPPDPRAQQRSPRDQARQVGDVLRSLNGFLFLACTCGLKVKIPPDYSKPSMHCPRCNTMLAVPVAQMQGAEQILAKVRGAAPPPVPPPVPGGIRTATPRTVIAAAPLVITRTPGQWQTFACSCGAKQNVSPGMLATQTTCKQCGRVIQFQSN